ncbi:nitrite reductase [Candidatus Nitromaritima sp. SCGC AAA799-A02]|nr:nitrite reductase [Candidatus Nitromaritima sp. SCGC AAA799-A02]KMP12176.1 nitrite reductase [Candidatus Nitromaritima sp. SCGC AAA799-C22]
MKEKLVLIGNGMAGVRTLEELLKIAPDLYDITVFGSEPYGNYNRILLSPMLAGEKNIDDIMLNDEHWYQENNIKLHTGKEVVDIDRRNRKVTAQDGTTEEYDRLLLATGSNSILLPIPGNDLQGVVTFRNIRDVRAMLEISEKKKQALVVGGGLLGLEAAYALKQQGMFVTVVHLMDSLMERQLDPEASAMLKKTLENRGIQFLMETATEAFLGEGEVWGARFKGGLEIAADLVVMAVGIRPNMDLARKARIYCDRGIVVNDTMQTYDGRIYAVGECVQHKDQVYGLVAPLFEQAKVCANHLAQFGFACYKGSITFSKLKVTGVELFSTGDFIGDETTENIVMKDVSKGIYKKIVLKENRIHGAVMFGDTVDGSWYYQLLRDRTDISSFRDQLLHGQSHLGGSGHGGANTAAEMSDDIEVCGCNGVCKGDIVKAITSKGLFTLDDVRDHTKASSSCGSCTGLVEQILTFTLGGDYSEAPKAKPLCKCTDYTHDEFRQTIKNQRLMSIRSVMDYLEYRTPDGCHVCRPAINYYLISSWPGEAADDPQSRFINERAHANIQKDGTYSVIPRVWGGLITPKELRAIADAAEKFEIPTVKITGGQRIGLYGLNKNKLPAVWADLNRMGMSSGYAYGKSLRTVKTCVGKEWCRFGTQDSTSMGVKLEKLVWGSWMPHKFKMAVSGCPRNCAEATIKDFGVVAVESGWELHIGGNGGVRVRPTELLCKVPTDQEVIEHCCAFIQLYREDAHYLERTAPWIERVGMSHVRKQLVEDVENRKALSDRFLNSQRFAQKDPWAERIGETGFEKHEFTPLEVTVIHG